MGAAIQIDHLLVRWAGRAPDTGAPAQRLRLERLLGAVDLRPAGMTASAVLVVRALRGAGPPPAAALPPQEWAAWLRRQIGDLYQAAARPALGPPPPDTSSVIFADAAELLACLTRDLLDGRARQRWYWQQVLRPLPRQPGAALAAAWAAHARFLPAALGLLRPDEARAAVALLAPAEVSAVVRALHAGFDLPPDVLVVVVPEAPRAQPQAAPPWQRWLPAAATPALTPQARYLLGLGLALQNAPAFARGAAFAARAASWLTAQLAGERRPTSDDRRATDGRRATSDDRRATTDERRATTDERRPTSDDEGSGPSGILDYFGEKEWAAEAERAVVPARPETPAPIAGRLPGGEPAEAAEAPPFVEGGAAPFAAEGVETRLGGVLYLINVLAWLGLPGGWDASESLAEHLGGWAIVEALGRALLGAAHEYYVDDPIWAALARLDQRAPGAAAGAGMSQLATFRLPTRWLRRYAPPGPAWVAAATGGRLCLSDAEAGYLVADLPLAGDAIEPAAEAAVGGYRNQSVAATWRPGPAPDLTPLDQGAALALSPAAGWWTARAIGFVRHLLAHATGGDVADLLYRQGRLRVSWTHVDLHMPIHQVSVALRRAGLDRDPGWAPDLGRIVLFHFE